MHLRVTLTRIAMLVSAGTPACGSVVSSPDDPDTGPFRHDASPAADGGVDGGPVIGCGGCNCGTPSNTSGVATPDQACAIGYSGGFGGDNGTPNACDTVCDEPNGAGGGLYCELPGGYSNALNALVADGGQAAISDASVDGHPCPAWSGTVLVQCSYACLGRRTDGVPSPGACLEENTGAVLAVRAYLEAVSVHGFVRLEAELAAHHAPAGSRMTAA